ncbi:hypothetical protein SEEC0006_14802 [Salmonella enterica subsp. enterica serovar Choleraesuis str. 0006]|nr:hypothetical protein SEEC0006_14802 [Salmonella enterica subsp. enterica serovar Choleraesuis str. 0006]
MLSVPVCWYSLWLSSAALALACAAPASGARLLIFRVSALVAAPRAEVFSWLSWV